MLSQDQQMNALPKQAIVRIVAMIRMLIYASASIGLVHVVC